MIRALDLARRWAPWIAAGAALLLFLLLGPAACQRTARLAAEQRVEREQRGAASGSARDALASASAANARERESDATTIRNQLEIRNAKGAASAIDPDVTRAGLDGLCRRAAYRDSERCRLRRTSAR